MGRQWKMELTNWEYKDDSIVSFAFDWLQCKGYFMYRSGIFKNKQLFIIYFCNKFVTFTIPKRSFQLEKSGLPPKPKRPSRRYRRRPQNLLSEYNRRQRNHIWLETHIWHAKRYVLYIFVILGKTWDKKGKDAYNIIVSVVNTQFEFI